MSLEPEDDKQRYWEVRYFDDKGRYIEERFVTQHEARNRREELGRAELWEVYEQRS